MKQTYNLEQVVSLEQAQAAVHRLAVQLNVHMANREGGGEVLALTLLNGGIVFTGMLLPHLTFPLKLDSICVSRYRDSDTGTDLQWHTKPRASLQNVDVLLLDDIYDQGITLSHVIQWCRESGVNSVSSAVLAWKEMPSGVDCGKPDFHALTVPDEFVVGLGMDYAGYERNAPGIFTVTFG